MTNLQSVRTKRCQLVYRKLLPRLAKLGFDSALCSTEGAVLAPNTPARTPPPPPAETSIACGAITLSDAGAPPSGPAPSGPAGAWLFLPLGKVKVDAWLAAYVPAGNPSAIAGALAFMVADAQQIVQLEAANTQFGERLVTVYEQIRVLFGLTRLLDGDSDAHHVVARVLDEIRQGLPFPWMALRFGAHPRLRKEVAGQFLLSGLSGIEREDLSDACAELLIQRPARLAIFSPDERGSLAHRLGTELVVAPVKYEGETVAVILAGEKGGEDPGVSSFETQFLEACAELLSIFHENLSRLATQKALFLGIVRALTSSIDAKHRYTRGHSERVSLLATLMARKLGMDDQTVATYKLSGLLHDVGKIGVPEAILSKPTRLTDEEFDQIKKHPAIGHDILRDIPGLEDALPGVISHHEQFCGKGYPHGLAGDEIPLLGRVLALCDTFDAMSSSRSYRSALSRETVLAEVSKCAGRQFDPELAALFLTLDFSSFDELFTAHGDQHALAA